MEEALRVWIAAIESRYARDGEWIPWADAWILKLDEPPLWLLHVCVEQSSREALSVLYPGLAYSWKEWSDPLDWIRLRLGFYYLAHERDQSDLHALFVKVFEIAENCNTIEAEVSELLKLWREVGERPAFVPGYRSLAERVAEAFKPFSDLARLKWSRLHDELPQIQL